MIECHIKNTCYIDDSRVRLLVLEYLKTGLQLSVIYGVTQCIFLQNKLMAYSVLK